MSDTHLRSHPHATPSSERVDTPRAPRAWGPFELLLRLSAHGPYSRWLARTPEAKLCLLHRFDEEPTELLSTLETQWLPLTELDLGLRSLTAGEVEGALTLCTELSSEVSAAAAYEPQRARAAEDWWREPLGALCSYLERLELAVARLLLPRNTAPPHVRADGTLCSPLDLEHSLLHWGLGRAARLRRREGPLGYLPVMGRPATLSTRKLAPETAPPEPDTLASVLAALLCGVVVRRPARDRTRRSVGPSVLRKLLAQRAPSIPEEVRATLAECLSGRDPATSAALRYYFGPLAGPPPLPLRDVQPEELTARLERFAELRELNAVAALVDALPEARTLGATPGLWRRLRVPCLEALAAASPDPAALALCALLPDAREALGSHKLQSELGPLARSRVAELLEVPELGTARRLRPERVGLALLHACDRSWESLEPTAPIEGREARHCNDCQRPVLRVDAAELERSTFTSHCVAVRPESVDR